MKVGIIQSSFIPWRGYFDFIASVDVFVFHDDIQYTKGDWRNRNRIKTANGTEWLTVPVSYKRVAQRICDTAIDRTTDWAAKHHRVWEENYRATPHFSDVMDILAGLGEATDMTISQLNVRLIRRICAYLGISTPLCLSADYAPVGTKTERLLDLIGKLGATCYLSGPSADDYLDKEAFRQRHIGLEYKSYDYGPYPQCWGAFEGAVTVLDLIANCGQQAVVHLRSRSPDIVVL